MAITYGFYNSINKDRVYNAEQVSSIFDGIIADGVYQGVPKNEENPDDKYYLKTRPGNGMQVIVGPGRAWFNHTWTLNDNDLPLTISPASIAGNRVDAVVLKVDGTDDVRRNDIYVHTGSVTDPNEVVYPTFEDTDDVHYHILAYIVLMARTETITADNIELVVGTDKTPFVAGVVNQVSVSSLLDQWAAEWDVFFNKEQADLEEKKAEWEAARREWLEYLEQTEADYQYLFNEASVEIREFIDSFKTWANDAEVDFYDWFQNLRNQLDENQAAHLQAEIDDLRTEIIPGSNSLSNVLLDESGHITDVYTSYINSSSDTSFSYDDGIYKIEKHFVNPTLEYKKIVTYDTQSLVMTTSYVFIDGDQTEFDTLVNTTATVSLDNMGFISGMDVIGDDYERHIAFQNTKHTSTVTDIVKDTYSVSAVYNKTAGTIATSRQIGGS